MSDNLNKLFETMQLDEDTKGLIQEAWNKKLSEAKDEIASELREEFAQKYTHDKKLIVKTVDNFLEETLKRELEELAEDKKSLAAQEVASKTQVKEHIKMLNDFIKTQMAKEVNEGRSSRVELKKGITVLEDFILKQLSEEIAEFQQDKKELQEQRVKLVREGRTQLVEAKKEFIQRAAKVVNEKIEKTMRSEIEQFRDDIKAARENSFGRKIFESFVGEYMSSYLNEGSEVRKLQKVIESKNDEIKATEDKLVEQTALTESVNQKLSATKSLVERNKTLSSLLKPLAREKKTIMKELLESVQTTDLKRKFDQYLPAVLNEGNVDTSSRGKKALNESVVSEKTGNRANNLNENAQNSDNIAEIENIKKLAGIK